MAGKAQNIAGLFKDARSRVIILVTLFILIFAIVLGYFGFRSRTEAKQAAETRVTAAPRGIRSVPGALDPSEQYAKLQEKQNIAQAKAAQQTGKSAIPTII